MADLTDDIIYQAPGEPEIIDKDAVRKWVAGYFGGISDQVEKTSIGFTVIGDWAFERYEYQSTDVNKKTGAVTTDKGKASTFSDGAPTGNGGWPSTDGAPTFDREITALPLRRPLLAVMDSSP